MKITDVEPLPIDRCLFVKVHTDAGTTGPGESGAQGTVETSRRYLVRPAISAIDVAPWGIAGKHVPGHQFTAGKVRDRARIYYRNSGTAARPSSRHAATPKPRASQPSGTAEAPFGGIGRSGTGRKDGSEGLMEFLDCKLIGTRI